MRDRPYKEAADPHPSYAYVQWHRIILTVYSMPADHPLEYQHLPHRQQPAPNSSLLRYTLRMPSTILSPSTWALGMSHLLLFLCATTALILPGITAGAITLSKPPNNLGLVGYWSFNEGTGTQAGDFSGLGNHGVLTSSPTWVSGKRGRALNFNTDNFVRVSGVPVTSAVRTYSAWISPRTSGESNFGTIIGTDVGGGAFTGLVWSLCSGDAECSSQSNTLQLYQFFSGNDGIWHTGANTITLNAWNHVALVYDSGSSTNEPVFYINGVLAATTEVQNPTGTRVTDTDFHIGAYDDSDNFGFDGLIDEVRVYNRALGASEIAKLYDSGAVRINASSADLTNGTTLEQGLVGHWTFDGPDFADRVYDRSGNPNHGVLFNVATASAKAIGRLGQGFNTDANDDEIRIQDHASLDILSSFTLATWFKADSFAAGGFRTLMAKQGDGGYYLETFDNEVSCGFNDGGAPFDHDTDTENLATGAWYHLACVFDDAGNTIKIYINGVEELSEARSGAPSGNNNSFYLVSVNGAQVVDGTMDDPRVYNRALSPAEVQQLYKLGTVRITQ